MTEPEDVGEVKQVKERKSKVGLRREHELADLRAVLETRAGRNLLWRILEQCGLYQANLREPHLMAIHEGRRSIGTWTLGEIMLAMPEAYARMRNEAVGETGA